MEGLINLHKPAGPTSHDMVDLLRRLTRRRRVGHGGTLDPLAEGVLPIAIGRRATRMLPFLQQETKTYRAEILLGVSTTTYDAAGEVTARRPPPPLFRPQVEEALRRFQGEIEQVPPPFSAVRLGGVRLYRRARAGEQVSPPPRTVRIERLTLLSWTPPRLQVEVECGGGTYIRSLAHDLGEALDCGACLAALVRLRVGPFLLEEAVTPADLAAAAAQGRLQAFLLPLDLPVRHWPAVHLDATQAGHLLHGRPLERHDPGPEGEMVRVYGPAGHFLALARWEGHTLRPVRVLQEVKR